MIWQIYITVQWCTSLRICQCTAGSLIMLSGNLMKITIKVRMMTMVMMTIRMMMVRHQLIFSIGLGQLTALGPRVGKAALLISSNAIKSGENHDKMPWLESLSNLCQNIYADAQGDLHAPSTIWKWHKSCLHTLLWVGWPKVCCPCEDIESLIFSLPSRTEYYEYFEPENRTVKSKKI